MATTIAISVPQNNQLVLTIQVTLPPAGTGVPGEPFSLAAFSLSMVVKASASATDASGTTYTPSITSATAGMASLTIPGSGNAAAGTFWYRLDVVDGSSNHVTAAQGNYQVTQA